MPLGLVMSLPIGDAADEGHGGRIAGADAETEDDAGRHRHP
jgi:hypothetical protein